MWKLSIAAVLLSLPLSVLAGDVTRDLRSFLNGSADTGASDRAVWAGRIKTRVLSFVDNGIFNSLQAGLSLGEADPGFAGSPIAAALDRAVDRYIEDAAKLNDPVGSIGYWPAKSIGSRSVRTFGKSEVDLPPDLDDSAIAAIWLSSRGRRKDWVASYLALLPKWTRPTAEGGFYTWVESRKTSRIPNGAQNDVDCVVQLNINSSIAAASKHGFPIAPDLEAASRKSCRIVEAALRQRLYPKCSGYYEYEGQFWHALARHVRLGNHCALDQRLIRERLLADSGSIRQETHNLAAFLFALKALIPLGERDGLAGERIAEVSAGVIRLLKRSPHGKFLNGGQASSGRLTVGGIRIMGHLGFHSDAYTTALALEGFALH